MQYKRIDSRYRSKSYDLDVLIAQGKYPGGGIEELQRGIFQLLPDQRKWIRKLKYNKIQLSVTDFCSFLKVLMALLYCLSCQGRPQAYEKITYEEFVSSWEQRRNPSHGNLKNRLSLHYQVLAIVEGPPSEFIDAYIQVVRPRLLEFINRQHKGKFYHSQIIDSLISFVFLDGEPFFLNSKGNAFRPTWLLTTFFKEHFNIHMNTTRLRICQEVIILRYIILFVLQIF